jgi:hypothetical protein
MHDTCSAVQDQTASSGMTAPVQLRGRVSGRMSGVSEALVITSACVGFVVVALLIAITAVYARRQRIRKAQGLASSEVRCHRNKCCRMNVVEQTVLLLSFCSHFVEEQLLNKVVD